MELTEYLRAFRRNIILFISVVIFIVALAAAYTVAQKPRYNATSSVYVSTATASNLNDLTQGSDYVQQVVRSYAQVATQAIVLTPVIRTLRLDTTPQALAPDISASVSVDAVIIEVNASASSPSGAADLANAVIDQLTRTVDELNPASGSTATSVKLTQTQPAIAPDSPSSPRPTINLAIGLIAGVLVAIVVVVIRELLDTRVRNQSDLTGLVDTPVLGAVPYERNPASRGLIGREGGRSARAEAYRALRTNLSFLNYDSPIKSIVVTSSIQGEGKTTLAANLAIVTASAGLRVLLIDADLRRPRLERAFQIEGSVGLTDYLVGDVELEKCIQKVGELNLDILPSGRLPPNPSEILQAKRMEKLIKEAAESYDLVILDAPPLLPVTDAAILAGRCDGALFVSAMKQVKRTQITGALSALNNVEARLLGIVMSKVPTRGADSYYYGGYEKPDDVPFSEA